LRNILRIPLELMRPDYYQILDVEPTARPAEIKQAYYRQARRFHPDCNDGDPVAEERFKLVAEAYRTLGNEARRRDYDERMERMRRYADAPELASMQRRVRVSARHGRARRAGEERHASARRYRPFLPRRVPRTMGVWTMVAIYAMAATMLVPQMLRGCGVLADRNRRLLVPEKDEQKPERSEAEKRASLEASNARLRSMAEAGEERAQLRLAIALYHGLGMPVNRPEAKEWFSRAAAQGNSMAAKCLQSLNFEQPAPAAIPPTPAE